MAFVVGDVVRVVGDDTEGAFGRICFDKGGGWFCVQWHGGLCLRNHEDDLEPADGDAPECTAACGAGQC